MKRFLIAAFVAWLAANAGSAQAADAPNAAQRAALMKPVNAWVRAFDAHDVRFPADAFTSDCVVIDEFAPFAWAPGETPSVQSWYKKVVGADGPKHRARVLASHEYVVVGEPENVRIAGDLAYMTFHAYWGGNFEGRRRVEHGLFVVVERKTAGGWLMSANSWGILR